MDVVESDLPGVGKKYEVPLQDGGSLIIVIHNTGKREIFRRESPDADSERVFELSDRLARTVGTILEGAHFQPVRSDRIQTMLSEGTLLEWYELGPDSPLVGQTLEEAEVGRKTGVTVVAIQREEEVIPSPGANTELVAGDTLVVVGAPDSCDAFEERLLGEQ